MGLPFRTTKGLRVVVWLFKHVLYFAKGCTEPKRVSKGEILVRILYYSNQLSCIWQLKETTVM